MEAENISLGVPLLEKMLPICTKVLTKGITDIAGLLKNFQLHRDKFAKHNKLEAAETSCL